MNPSYQQGEGDGKTSLCGRENFTHLPKKNAFEMGISTQKYLFTRFYFLSHPLSPFVVESNIKEVTLQG